MPASPAPPTREHATTRPAGCRPSCKRSRPPTLAAASQYQLLPPWLSCEAAQFTLCGSPEPSAALSGDTFDHALDRDTLRDLYPGETALMLTSAVLDAAGGRLKDDATVMCLDWHGPQHTRRHVDDGDRCGQQQRAGSGDHQDGDRACRGAADQPRQPRYREGQGQEPGRVAVGAALNPITDAIRRADGVEWIGCRYEEAAAFAAGAQLS